MIDFYTWTTPNGKKIAIALEEMELPYRVHWIDIGKGEQFAPDFLNISPNNRIPAIVDHNTADGTPLSVFESGAILQYLGDKTGLFYGKTARDRVKINEWLNWQMGGFGPMAGQAHHFLKWANVDIPYAKTRYRDEVTRLYSVLDKALADREFIAGEYSIADMAIFGWALHWERQEQRLEDFPNVLRYVFAIGNRPAVQRALCLQPKHQ